MAWPGAATTAHNRPSFSRAAVPFFVKTMTACLLGAPAGGAGRAQAPARAATVASRALLKPAPSRAAAPSLRGCRRVTHHATPAADSRETPRPWRRGSRRGALRADADASSAPPPLRWPGEAAVALRCLRDEAERRGAAYRRALAAARRHDVDDSACALEPGDAPDAGAAAQLCGEVQRYAAATDDLDRLCAAAECGFGGELVAMAVTAPGREMVSDAQLAEEAEHLWRCSDAA